MAKAAFHVASSSVRTAASAFVLAVPPEAQGVGSGLRDPLRHRLGACALKADYESGLLGKQRVTDRGGLRSAHPVVFVTLPVTSK